MTEQIIEQDLINKVTKLKYIYNENSKRNQAKQKLGKETYAQRLEPFSNKGMAIIFDECHRSQFGDNHEAIKEFFPKKLNLAVKKLDDFMKSQGLENKLEEVPNLKGDAARASFINHFKKVQRLKTGLDQYTDLSIEQKQTIEARIPKKQLQGFKGVYIELKHELRADNFTNCIRCQICR